MAYKDPDQKKAYEQRWREANKDRVRETHRAYREANRQEILERKRAYYRANKEKLKAAQRGREPTEREKVQRAARARQRNTNATPGLFDSLLCSQMHLCAVCKVDLREIPSHRVHADHDHTTGRVRGVLCASCNMALGLLKDDPGIVERAASYLRSPTRDWM